jgi:hypothetical protein
MRRAGIVFASMMALGATAGMGGLAFAGQGSSQCSQGVCETNYGGYGYSSHYVSSQGEYHNFYTNGFGGRSDRP